MVMRLFLGYLVAELAALVALVSTIGFGRTLLVLLIVFVAGLVLAGSQARRQLGLLRSGAVTGRQGLTDSALVALGTVLVVVPGLVTSAVGLLLLMPVTRAVARPVLAAIALGRFGRRAPLVTTAPGPHRRAGYDDIPGEVIDGEVIDGQVIDGEVIDGRVVPRGPSADWAHFPRTP